MMANHPDYASLAARISVLNFYNNTNKSFSEMVKGCTIMLMKNLDSGLLLSFMMFLR